MMVVDIHRAVKLLIGCLCLCGLSLAESEIIESWQFDDPSGTPLSKLVNEVSASHFDNAKNAATDGQGCLVVARGANAQSNLYRAVPVSCGGQSTGRYEMTVELASVLFASGAQSGANVGFSMRGPKGAALWLVRLHKQDGKYVLQSRQDGITTDLYRFKTPVSEALKNLSIKMIFDLDAKVMDVYWRMGERPESVYRQISLSDRPMGQIKLLATTNTHAMGEGDHIKINCMSLRTLSGYSSPVLLGLGNISVILLNEKK